MTDKYRYIETKLIHSGEPEPRIDGAVSMPIFQTAMFLSAGEQSYHDIRYLRLNNTPNHIVLHDKLAALENMLNFVDRNLIKLYKVSFIFWFYLFFEYVVVILL